MTAQDFDLEKYFLSLCKRWAKRIFLALTFCVGLFVVFYALLAVQERPS